MKVKVTNTSNESLDVKATDGKHSIKPRGEYTGDFSPAEVAKMREDIELKVEDVPSKAAQAKQDAAKLDKTQPATDHTKLSGEPPEVVTEIAASSFPDGRPNPATIADHLEADAAGVPAATHPQPSPASDDLRHAGPQTPASDDSIGNVSAGEQPDDDRGIATITTAMVDAGLATAESHASSPRRVMVEQILLAGLSVGLPPGVDAELEAPTETPIPAGPITTMPIGDNISYVRGLVESKVFGRERLSVRGMSRLDDALTYEFDDDSTMTASVSKIEAALSLPELHSYMAELMANRPRTVV